MPLVERRYAEALVDISVLGRALDEYQEELKTIVGLFNDQPDFKFFLLNPEIKTETKKDIIKKLFSGKARNEIVNFIMLLLDKERIKFLPGIYNEFAKMADKKRNVLNMTIISAAPLQDTQVMKLKEKYRKMYNASLVKAEVQIDQSIIGGVKVKIGDKIADGSIKGRIESLKDLLVK